MTVRAPACRRKTGRAAAPHGRPILRQALKICTAESYSMKRPLSPRFPRYRETYVITLVDKFCAVAEVMTYFLSVGFRGFRLAETFAPSHTQKNPSVPIIPFWKEPPCT